MIHPNRLFRVALLLVAVSLLALSVGCARKDKSTSPNPNDLPAEILNLMRDRTSGNVERGCMGCHNAANSARADLTTYDQVFLWRASVRSKINGGSMSGYLLAGEHAVIINWIDAGAPR
jgi:hypothetical protein